jgi:hypothetical protein
MKFTNPESSTDLNHMKYEEEYSKAYLYLLKNSDKWKILKAAQMYIMCKDTLLSQEQR